MAKRRTGGLNCAQPPHHFQSFPLTAAHNSAYREKLRINRGKKHDNIEPHLLAELILSAHHQAMLRFKRMLFSSAVIVCIVFAARPKVFHHVCVYVHLFGCIWGDALLHWTHHYTRSDPDPFGMHLRRISQPACLL